MLKMSKKLDHTIKILEKELSEGKELRFCSIVDKDEDVLKPHPAEWDIIFVEKSDFVSGIKIDQYIFVENVDSPEITNTTFVHVKPSTFKLLSLLAQKPAERQYELLKEILYLVKYSNVVYSRFGDCGEWYVMLVSDKSPKDERYYGKLCLLWFRPVEIKKKNKKKNMRLSYWLKYGLRCADDI